MDPITAAAGGGLFDSITGGGLLSAGASIFNGIMGASSQSDINSANIANSVAQRDWETNMSNTAHQREVADLTAAGLNPILSATRGGASTPSYQLPVLQSPYQAGVNAASGASQSALNYSHSGLANKQAETESKRPAQVEADTENLRELAHKVGYENVKLIHESESIVRGIDLTEAQISKVREETWNAILSGKLIEADTGVASADEALRRVQIAAEKLSMPEREAMASYWKSTWGKASPYGRDVAGVVSSGAKGAAAGAIINRMRR